MPKGIGRPTPGNLRKIERRLHDDVFGKGGVSQTVRGKVRAIGEMKQATREKNAELDRAEAARIRASQPPKDVSGGGHQKRRRY